MKSFLRKRNSILVIGIISILAITILVPIVASLHLEPEKPFLTGGEVSDTGPSGGFPPALIYISIILMAIVMILFIRWLSPEQRRRFFWGLLRLLALLILGFLIFSQFEGGEEIFVTPEATQMILETPPENVPLPTQGDVPVAVFTPPQVDPWVSYLVTVIILLTGLGLWWWWSRRRKAEDLLLNELAGAAQSAITDIQAGREWENAIFECYAKMSQIVGEHRGFRRQLQVTPTEFVQELERARLPGEAVRRLTTLFERVRYGDKKSTKHEIDEAVNCLTLIVKACQEIA